jgi:polyhydroxyalkanoate synthesis repressor PhaR
VSGTIVSDDQTKPKEPQKEPPKEPIVIKKYANRRLYNTATSAYVTLEDLSAMVRAGQDFAVYDAKTGEEITRSVLTQIIFEEENKTGAQTLLPINFLRQLIRFYGDQMQGVVPGYLEMSLDGLMKEQEKFRKQMMDAMGTGVMPGIPGAALPADMMKSMEEQTRKNMAMFQDAMKAFNPFLASMSTGMGTPNMGAGMGTAHEKPAAKPETAKADDLETLKQQMAAMTERLESLSRK